MKYIDLPQVTKTDRYIISALVDTKNAFIESSFTHGVWKFRLAIPESSSSEIPNSSTFDKDGWREFTGTDEAIQEGDEYYNSINNTWVKTDDWSRGIKASKYSDSGFRTKRPLPTEITPEDMKEWKTLDQLQRELNAANERAEKAIDSLERSGVDAKRWQERAEKYREIAKELRSAIQAGDNLGYGSPEWILSRKEAISKLEKLEEGK